MNACANQAMGDHSAVKVFFLCVSNQSLLYCALELQIQGWNFNGSSYLQYRTQFRRTIRQMVIDLAFRAEANYGLVMFASRFSDGSGPFFIIQLNETLEFIMNTGNDISSFVSLR